MSYRITRRIALYRAMLCHMSCRRVVSPFRVVSCRVLSRPVVSMWWFPNSVCAQASFAKGSCQSHSTDSDQIANGTPASWLLILKVVPKKKNDQGTRQAQRAQMNNAPEHDPRRRTFGSTTTRQPSSLFGSWCCLSKKKVVCTSCAGTDQKKQLMGRSEFPANQPNVG